MPGKHEPRAYAWFTEARLTLWLKVLLTVVLALYLLSLVLQFLERIGTITFLVIGAIFFAYLIYPLVRRLNRYMPTVLAILTVYASFVIVVVLGAVIVLPPLMNDVSSLAAQYPKWLALVRAYLDDPSNPWLMRVPEPVRVEIAKLPGQVVGWAQEHGVAAASHAVSIVVGTIAAIATFVIIPVLAAYLMLEAESIRRSFVAIIPPARRPAMLHLLGELEGVIGGFIRGQLLVGLSIGVFIMIALLILRVPYAVLIGVAAGILDFIPYIGPVLAFVPAFFIALVNHGWVSAVWVAAVFVVANQIEGHFIAPNLVSRSVSLSPLAVLLAILIGGELGGVLGMFVAVPIAGMLRVLVLHVVPAAPPEASVGAVAVRSESASRE